MAEEVVVVEFPNVLKERENVGFIIARTTCSLSPRVGKADGLMCRDAA